MWGCYFFEFAGLQLGCALRLFLFCVTTLLVALWVIDVVFCFVVGFSFVFCCGVVGLLFSCLLCLVMGLFS